MAATVMAPDADAGLVPQASFPSEKLWLVFHTGREFGHKLTVPRSDHDG